MATPFQALVDEIRGLNGAPKVTYPEGSADHPTVERVLRLKRGQDTPNFGEADPDSVRFPDNTLVDQVELKSDPQWVEVYRKYIVLPGPILTGSQTDKTTGIVFPYQKQRVAAGSVQSGVTGAGILRLALISGGEDFTGNGTLVFSGGGGSGATGTFTHTSPFPAGQIDVVTLTSGGFGFTSIPSATASGGGSGAAFTVQLVGKPIASLALNSSDSTFDDAATITITDTAGTGSGARGTATLTPTGIDSGRAQIGNGGANYDGTSTVTIGAPDVAGGTQATATLVLDGGGTITDITVVAAGSGYLKRPSVSIDPGSSSGSGAVIYPWPLTATSVASVTLTSSGNNYQNPLVTCSQVTSSASVTAVIQPTSVASISLASPGSGYSASTITFLGGGGSGASATFKIKTGSVAVVTLTNPGANYTSAPTVTTSGGGGTGAVIMAVLGSLTYVEIEEESLLIDHVMRTSVDLSTLPAPKSYPISSRIEKSDTQSITFDYVFSNGLIDIGVVENSKRGGTAPAPAMMTFYYMTESEYMAFSVGGFASSGKSETNTIAYGWVDARGPHVLNARVTPISRGTSIGILDITGEQQQYGVWKVRVISNPNDYSN